MLQISIPRTKWLDLKSGLNIQVKINGEEKLLFLKDGKLIYFSNGTIPVYNWLISNDCWINKDTIDIIGIPLDWGFEKDSDGSLFFLPKDQIKPESLKEFTFFQEAA